MRRRQQKEGRALRQLILAALLAPLSALGCGDKAAPPPSPVSSASAPARAVEPPAPAPARLLAEVALASPDALWKRVQRTVGGALALLPPSFGGVVVSVAGLDPASASEIDEGAPAFAVLAERDDGIAWAAAIKLVDPARARRALLSARVTPREVGDVTVLVAKEGASPAAVGLTRTGWLLMARDDDALAQLGPYTHRTMARRPPGAAALEIVVGREAVAGPLRLQAARRWGAVREGLGEGDKESRFAAVFALIDAAIKRRLDALGDVREARMTVDTTPDGGGGVRAELTLSPAPGGEAARAVAAMRVGDTQPLLAVAGDAALAVMLRDDAQERAAGLAEVEAAAARALGVKEPEDARRLRGALEAWSKGRGDWVTLALGWGQHHGLMVHAPVLEREALSRGISGGVELVQRPALREALRGSLGVREVTVGQVEIAPLGKANVATFVRDGKEEPKAPPRGLAWFVGERDAYLVTGTPAPALLGFAAKPPSTLEADPVVAAAVKEGDLGVSFAMMAQPLRWFGRGGGSTPQSAVLLWGRRAGAAVLRLELAAALVRELVRLGVPL